MIFTICPADNAQGIVDAAKKAGSTGATILSVRGTGHKEAKTFFGLTLDRPQEALIMLVPKPHSERIMSVIYNAGAMKEPGNGICFALPVEAVMGLESQLSIMENKD